MKLNSIFLSVSVVGAALMAAAPSTAQAQARHRDTTTYQRASNTFSEFDRNRDGRIGSFEYRRKVSQRFARWMARVDRDRDGYLTGREKQRAQRTSPVSWRGDVVRRARIPMWHLWAKHMERARVDFQRLDRNRDGFVSRREFRRSKRNRDLRYDRAERVRAVPARDRWR